MKKEIAQESLVGAEGRGVMEVYVALSIRTERSMWKRGRVGVKAMLKCGTLICFERSKRTCVSYCDRMHVTKYIRR